MALIQHPNLEIAFSFTTIKPHFSDSFNIKSTHNRCSSFSWTLSILQCYLLSKLCRSVSLVHIVKQHHYWAGYVFEDRYQRSIFWYDSITAASLQSLRNLWDCQGVYQNPAQHAVNFVSNCRRLEVCCFGINNSKSCCSGCLSELHILTTSSCLSHHRITFHGLEEIPVSLDKEPELGT